MRPMAGKEGGNSMPRRLASPAAPASPATPAAYHGAVFPSRLGWVGAVAGPAGVAALTLPTPDPDDARSSATAALPRGARSAVRWLSGGTAPEEGAGLLADVAAQVRDYLEGRRPRFDFPLDLAGRSPFARRVLEETARIPYGEVRSYGQLAAGAGRPGAARAVGQVMAKNPVCLAVPCHRVVGSDGRLTGFGGGLELKRRLLELEGARAPSLRVWK